MGRYEDNLELIKPHLKDGEKIQFSIFGKYKTFFIRFNLVKSGIFVVTESRILFYAKRFRGYRLEVFPLKSITSFQQGKTILGPTITLFTNGTSLSIKWISKGNFDGFMKYVRANIGGEE